MTTSVEQTHDPINALYELREQLASDKRRIGFFFGAGTSMSVGIPGIDHLTTRVAEALLPAPRSVFETIRQELDGVGNANVEHILNRIRLCRELIGETTKEFDGLSRDGAKSLDASICRAIYDVVQTGPAHEIGPHLILAQWLHAFHSNRDSPIEIFTTNYDVLLERAMELVGVPFFDGFIGAVNPFFSPECVESDGTKLCMHTYPPPSWTRLWKLHGSIGWRLRQNALLGKAQITRLSDSAPEPGEELMIFPSREKYADSRKLPYLTLQDRLRKYLATGEALLVISGYSFSDEHINEILFQALRSNTRLAVTALIFENLPDPVRGYARAFRSLSVYSQDKACIGGLVGKWVASRDAGNQLDFWEPTAARFKLGDFKVFARYLESFIGFRPTIPQSPEEARAMDAGLPAAGR